MKAPSEKHLEDWIVDNFQCLGDIWDANEYPPHPCEPDVWLSDTEYIFPYFERLLKRQVKFPFGIADLIVKGFDNVTAVELKMGGIDGETVSQVQRYMNALKYIYSHVTDVVRAETPEIAEHLPYWETHYPDAGFAAVGGMVIGHSLKDDRLVPLCTALGIEVVTYDYEPSTDTYRFERLGGNHSIGRRMVEVAGDYADGVLGLAFREVISMTVREIKRQKELRHE